VDAGGAGAGSAAAAAVRTWQAMRASGACPPDCRPVVALDATEPAAREAAARVADLALVRAVSPERAGHVRDELRALAARAGRDPDRLLVLADLAVDLGGGELGAEPGAEPAPVADAGGGPLFRGGPVDLADLVARWQRAGAVDGFHVRPVEPARDLERFVNGTVALLQHRGLFRTFHPGATLREHLGLHRRPRKATSTHMEGWDDEHTSS
jgi:alkanesulfonate monooxygenase SsuD/methylene tetrahydromethanopterin reductase-like flavin-dependent oxidoreductase (luciferase family)